MPKYHGEHPCGIKITIYYNVKELWKYECPRCKFPIEKRQLQEVEYGRNVTEYF